MRKPTVGAALLIGAFISGAWSAKLEVINPQGIKKLSGAISSAEIQKGILELEFKSLDEAEKKTTTGKCRINSRVAGESGLSLYELRSIAKNRYSQIVCTGTPRSSGVVNATGINISTTTHVSQQ